MHAWVPREDGPGQLLLALTAKWIRAQTHRIYRLCGCLVIPFHIGSVPGRAIPKKWWHAAYYCYQYFYFIARLALLL